MAGAKETTLAQCVERGFRAYVGEQAAAQREQNESCQPPTCRSDGEPADVSIDAELVEGWVSDCNEDQYSDDPLPAEALGRISERVRTVCDQKQQHLAAQRNSPIRLDCGAPPAVNLNAAQARAAKDADALLRASLAGIIGRHGGSGNWNVRISYDPRKRPVGDPSWGENGRVYSISARPANSVTSGIKEAVNKALNEAATSRQIVMPPKYLNSDTKGTTVLTETLPIEVDSSTLARTD